MSYLSGGYRALGRRRSRQRPVRTVGFSHGSRDHAEQGDRVRHQPRRDAMNGDAAAERLELIRREIIDDPANAEFTRRGFAPLYSAGPDAAIVIIGQAPGARAQESGVAWDDASGDGLRDWLGVTRDEFYDPDRISLLPMDFFYPGKGESGDLPPRKGFAPTWHPRILRELTRVRLTILIGAYAQKHYLGPRAKSSLTLTVRSFDDYLPAVFPLVHPSPLNFRWQTKNPWFRVEVIPALRSAVRASLPR
jgi:uracil-DNA glycosylase